MLFQNIKTVVVFYCQYSAFQNGVILIFFMLHSALLMHDQAKRNAEFPQAL